tara:strand:+ start:1707 stop:1883 length:177 start_codon:yes stop_codon:yes gene_type:complete
MARTNRRREPEDVANPNKSMKKNNRRSNRKNFRNNIKKIDYSRLENDEDDVSFIKGYD